MIEYTAVRAILTAVNDHLKPATVAYWVEKMDVDYKRIQSSLQTYLWIMHRIHETDVSTDADFQRRFNGFYRIRQKPSSFYHIFYHYFEQNKDNQHLTFEDVVTYLHHATGYIYASFSSKLLATVRPDMPVWDKFVLQNLNLRAPYFYDKARLQKTVAIYAQICSWYTTTAAAEKIAVFNRQFPDTDISDVKKADYILWASR